MKQIKERGNVMTNDDASTQCYDLHFRLFTSEYCSSVGALHFLELMEKCY
jgi:hypothetical protein